MGEKSKEPILKLDGKSPSIFYCKYAFSSYQVWNFAAFVQHRNVKVGCIITSRSDVVYAKFDDR